jgi:hypothetical protein
VQPISAAGERLLRELGWDEPMVRREIDNWHRTLWWPLSRNTLVALARSVAIGLHEALGVDTPVELRAMGWTEASGDLNLTALGSIARRGVG